MDIDFFLTLWESVLVPLPVVNVLRKFVGRPFCRRSVVPFLRTPGPVFLRWYLEEAHFLAR